MDRNDLVPLEWAAEHLSVFNFPDTASAEQVLQWLELYGNKGGPFPPLYALRRLFSIEYRPRVDYWVRAGMLKIHPRPDGDGAQEASDRWVRCSDIEELLPVELPWEKEDLPTDESSTEGNALDDEYDLGEVEYAAMTLGHQWCELEEREHELRERHAQGETEPLSLKAWFLRDNWTTREGLLLLLGLIPESCVELDSSELDAPRIVSARHLDGSLVSFDDWRLANLADDMARNHGRPLRLDESLLVSRQSLNLSREWQYMQKIWDSGDHPPRNPPSYFIAWAGRKNFPPSWLGWARANGLFGHEDEATGLGVEMPYDPDHGNPFAGMAATVSLPEFMQRVRNISQWGAHAQEIRMRLLDALPSMTAREAGKDIWITRYATSPTPKRPREVDPASLAPYIDHDASVLGSYFDIFAPERVWMSREWVLAWLERAALLPKDEPEAPISDQSESIRVDSSRVKSMQAQYLDIVIKTIRGLGYDPENLPEGEPGKPGIRNAVKLRLMEQPWFTESKFKKAWEEFKGRNDH